MLVSLREIRGWIQAGKAPEIEDKMRLVEISAVQRHVRPVDFLLVMDATQHVLKTSDTSKLLRRQPHFFAENLDESPRAQANLPGHGADRARGRQLKFLQRKADGRMRCQRPACLRQKRLFEQMKSSLQRLRAKQLLAQSGGGRSP